MPETTAEPKTTPETTAEPTTTVAPCSDTWEFCSGGTCYYRVDWSYHQTTDDITFTISARTQPTKWVAIGFSNQKLMVSMKRILLCEIFSSSYCESTFLRGHNFRGLVKNCKFVNS